MLTSHYYKKVSQGVRYVKSVGSAKTELTLTPTKKVKNKLTSGMVACCALYPNLIKPNLT